MLHEQSKEEADVHQEEPREAEVKVRGSGSEPSTARPPTQRGPVISPYPTGRPRGRARKGNAKVPPTGGYMDMDEPMVEEEKYVNDAATKICGAAAKERKAEKSDVRNARYRVRERGPRFRGSRLSQVLQVNTSGKTQLMSVMDLTKEKEKERSEPMLARICVQEHGRRRQMSPICKRHAGRRDGRRL